MGGYQNISSGGNYQNFYVSIMGGTLHCVCNCNAGVGLIYYAFIGGGYENRILANCNQTIQLSAIGGGLQNRITTNPPGGKSASGDYKFIGGGRQNCLERNSNNTVIFGGCLNRMTSSNRFAVILGGTSESNAVSCVTQGNYLYKTSGKFSIRHPDPDKAHTHKLVHSFVEAPTTGENLYRFEVETQNCAATVCLPSYYKFLNCNDQVWITPKDHMGVAYGTVNSQQTEINITSNCDSSYYVLLIGTRKDEKATFRWRGVEQDSIIPN